MTGVAFEETRTLVDELLAEQQRLTPVERFARDHDRGEIPAQSRVYRELLPVRAPGRGEQYAFAVHLDACSGCKACVTACHNLNGLDEDEIWRSIGLLHGGTEEEPILQTVTTSCHHCLEPACLQGCPVLAYAKDPRTGIVRHLDDQCIGCQYCILQCPYDVPKYSRKRGIVRKCDMCANRLAVNEPPACAQACPGGAIRITIVNQAAIIADAREGLFLPGAPDPAHTQPTTRYHGQRTLRSEVSAADAHALRPSHAHPALVAMLVLTQLSVGAFCGEGLLRALFPANLMMQLSPAQSLAALAAGLVALGTSTLHLGRPLAAWRAVIGLRTSWLSREIVAFGVFSALAILNASGYWLSPLRSFNSAAFGEAVELSGLAGVFCSVMIYGATRRAVWRGSLVGPKFFGSTAMLGTAAILFVTTLQALLSPEVAIHGGYQELTLWLSKTLVVICVAKLGFEAAGFRHLRGSISAPLRQAALLMAGELREITTVRFLLGAVGGVLLPLVFIVQRPAPGVTALAITVWMLVFVSLGEVLERHLFFIAVPVARMPGGIDA